MKEDNKLLDAIINLGVGMKELREDMKGIREEIKGMRKDINALHDEQHKTNTLLAEHSRSIIKLAEKINIVTNHETRIIRLEDATFGKDAQRISMVKEPNAEYKKKKKK